MSKLTGLLPLKIKTDSQLQSFKTCFSSYKFIIEKYKINLKIADESDENYSQEVRTFLKRLDITKNFIGSDGFVDAIQNLIQAVNTEYFFFILDDVELLKQKDFIAPSLAAFKENRDLIQVKYGGGLSAGKNKKQNLALYKHDYKPFEHDLDIVWINKIGLDREAYIFSHYNCVLKTEIFQKIDSLIKVALPHFDAYVVFLKKHFRLR